VNTPRHLAGTARQFTALDDRYALVRTECTEQDVLFDVLRYGSINEVLDDLFTHYLSRHVGAFTYGAEWIISGEPFDTRLLVPGEWVHAQERPVSERSPKWLQSMPEDLGFIAGTQWTVRLTKESEHYEKAYVLACLMLLDAKAAPLLLRHGSLKEDFLDHVQLHDYHYVHVFRDWLSICKKGALVEAGKHELPDQVKARLEERAKCNWWFSTVEGRKKMRRLHARKEQV
jgi:hypothetical protein